MLLCNVSQKKKNTPPPCLLLLGSRPHPPSSAQSCIEFCFTSRLMTSCPRTFRKHPSSKGEGGQQRRHEKWSGQVEPSVARTLWCPGRWGLSKKKKKKGSEQKEKPAQRFWFHVMGADVQKTNCWWISSTNLCLLKWSLKWSSSFVPNRIWHCNTFHFRNVGLITAHRWAWFFRRPEQSRVGLSSRESLQAAGQHHLSLAWRSVYFTSHGGLLDQSGGI